MYLLIPCLKNNGLLRASCTIPIIFGLIMKKVLIKNIGLLYQTRELAITKPLCGVEEMSDLPSIQNAYLAIEDGLIADFGSMDELAGIADWTNLDIIDAEGAIVGPGWIDSHTHLIFAETREGEYLDRLRGLSYQEIAEKGGGIINSAKKLQAKSAEDLFRDAETRAWQLIRQGTTALEIKSGYGLTLEAEIKMLEVAQRLKATLPITVKTTLLAAHAFPPEFKEDKEGYVSLIIEQIIPEVGRRKLADYIDAFCEEGYFTVDQTLRIVKAGMSHGLKPKVHVNQFTSLGSVEPLVKMGALSLDHLEEMSEADYAAMENKNTLAVGLPGCSFFLGIPYTPVKQMMERNIPIALASDFNPGSTPCGNMNTIHMLACTQMKLTPEQAINAATVNAACAMESHPAEGAISVGQKANLIFFAPRVKTLSYLSYSFGDNLVDKVMVGGEMV